MATLSNYIPDTNRFHLAGPPDWWLKQLWDFDQSLVVVPSRQGFYYRLAQRRPLKLPELLVNDLLFRESDTRMLAGYSLVPVTTILATARWDNPLMWIDLAERAPWRMGGAARVTKMIEDREQGVKLAQQKQISEHLDYLSRDAWNLYRQKIGLRSHMWSPRSSPVVPIDPNKKVPHATIFPATFAGTAKDRPLVR